METKTNTMPKVGDIFSSSWGYDQTNVDFYQVVKVLNKSVEVQRISGNEVPTGMMQGETTPCVGAFCGEPKRHLIKFGSDGRPGFRVNSFAWAFLTDATTKHYCSHTH